MTKTAILIDGGFFLKRYYVVYGRSPMEDGADKVTKTISNICLEFQKKFEFDLLKIFYYDCFPYINSDKTPISGKTIDFSQTSLAQFKLKLYYELKKTRKMVLRLGELKTGYGWLIKPMLTKGLLKGTSDFKSLTDDDFYFDLQQKGVDMKIGLDISTFAYKKQVDQIILVAGDADFVPAAKVARREGIDFILDPMWQHIDDELFEHIDGIYSVCPNPNQKNKRVSRTMS
ncbi:MAG: NYN domain-containing protein [Candidatus Riflemargulisbacteria bacterium]